MWYVRCSTKHYNFLGRRFFVTVELGLICISRLTSFIMYLYHHDEESDVNVNNNLFWGISQFTQSLGNV